MAFTSMLLILAMWKPAKIISGFPLNVHIAIPYWNHPRNHALTIIASVCKVSLACFTALAWFVFWVCVDSAIAAGYV